MAGRFWAKVDRSGGDLACWPWLASKRRNGYGQIGIRREGRLFVESAHRVAWELTHGPIPEGVSICHHCDNRPCCNPGHLFRGSQTDNMQDAAQKGRMKGNGGRAPLAYCKRGHRMIGENILYRPDGRRSGCKACGLLTGAARSLAWYHRNKSKRSTAESPG